MKTIYDHDRLIARFRPVDMWVLLEKPDERGSAQGMRRSAPYLPVLQSSQFDRQTGLNQDPHSLGLAEIVGFTPTPQILNHGRHVFRHPRVIMAEAVREYQM
jgi:hypothetical protein